MFKKLRQWCGCFSGYTCGHLIDIGVHAILFSRPRKRAIRARTYIINTTSCSYSDHYTQVYGFSPVIKQHLTSEGCILTYMIEVGIPRASKQYPTCLYSKFSSKIQLSPITANQSTYISQNLHSRTPLTHSFRTIPYLPISQIFHKMTIFGHFNPYFWPFLG